MAPSVVVIKLPIGRDPAFDLLELGSGNEQVDDRSDEADEDEDEDPYELVLPSLLPVNIGTPEGVDQTPHPEDEPGQREDDK